jgi:hypothetical protein
MLVYQFYITFPLLIDYTQEISPYICSFLLLFLPSVNRPSFLDALKFHYLLYIVYDLISYRASIGMFYCSTHCIFVYKNVIVSISPIDEIFYLLGLHGNFIPTCFVKCKLHIDNIQVFFFSCGL